MRVISLPFLLFAVGLLIVSCEFPEKGQRDLGEKGDAPLFYLIRNPWKPEGFLYITLNIWNLFFKMVLS